MTYKEYQTSSKRTCTKLENDKLDLCHMILGIHSESNEVFTAIRNLDNVNIGEELSDGIFYLSNYCTFRRYDLEEIFTKPVVNMFNEEYNSSQLADIVKKYIAYGKEINKVEEFNILRKLAFNYLDAFSTHNLDIFKCLHNNIKKLKIRFPEKFSTDLALNRNLKAERIELEK